MVELLLTFMNGLARALLLFTMASGLSLLFGVMNVLNLSHGALLALGGYVAVAVASSGGMPLALAVAVGVGGAAGLGLFLMVRPIAARPHLDQGLLTLGVAFIFSDIARELWGDDVYLPAPPAMFEGSVTILGESYPTYRLVIIVVGAVIAAGVLYTFERTRVGMIVRAAVADREMVAALGYRVGLISAAVFVVAAVLAAVGGVLGAPLLGVRPGLDDEMLILALSVIVIGGLGSLWGALLGAFIIGEAQTLGVLLIPEVAPFLVFGVMACVLIARPDGIIGKGARA